MATRLPTSSRSMWLARIGIGLIFLIAIVMSQVARLELVERTVQGQTTTFTAKWWLSLVWVMPTLPMAALAIAAWMRPGRLYKVVSVFLVAMSILLIAFVVPTSLIHRAVLTPDGFDLRVGAWYAPRSYSIRFDDVESADIEEDPEGRSGPSRQYVLACYLKTTGPQDPLLLPINDMVKRALRQIVAALKARGAVLDALDDGLDIPPELTHWLR